MAWRVLAGGMMPAQGGRYRFRLAGSGDSTTINRLLAETPMGGRFGLTLERAPDPFLSDFDLSPNHLILLGEDGEGEPVGLCERTVYPAFFDGAPAAIPYIGALRVLPQFRNRLAIIRGGFEALALLGEQAGEADFALTSIAADNGKALRLLTAGLSGLPRYRPAGDLCTFVLRARKRSPHPAIRAASPADFPAIAAFLNRRNARFQFAPVWTADSLAGLAGQGLEAGHMLIEERDGQLTGCIAAWDQSSRRQTVIRHYSSSLARLRPLVNLIAPLAGLPRLPPSGEVLKQVALSHCAVENDDAALFLALVDAALAQAAERGFDSGFIGLAAANALADHLRRSRRAIEYRTALHTVHWPERPEPRLSDRIAQPEAALL